ncbi:MAG: ATP-binding protein [Myxococcales bacterium]|nr:ATP-binding protein [Myxococcales bacterium]
MPTFGRLEALATLEREFGAGHRCITLHGPPGIGKTHLAGAFAERARVAGRDVVEVHVRPEDVLSGLARRAQVVARTDALLDTVAEALDAASALVVLDEAEVALEEVATLVGALLSATDRIQVLVTSQRALGLPAERVQRVEPLDASASEALVRAVAPACTPAAVASIVALGGGLPLALLLAAHDGGVEATRADDALADALDRALARLSVDARALLVAAAAFVGGGPLPVVAAVAGLELTRATRAHRELGSAGLTTREGRVELHDAIARRVRPESLRLPFARAMAAAAASFDASELARERDNLLAAFHSLVEASDPSAAELAVALDSLLVRQGPPALHRATLEQALAVPRLFGATRRALLRALARMHALHGRYDAALPPLEEGARAAREAGDRASEGSCLALGCFVRRPLGDETGALADGAAALRIAEETHDRPLEAMAAQAMGLVHLAAGRPIDAERWEVRALAAAEAGGAPRVAAIALANAGVALSRQGRLTEAARALDDALARFGVLDDRFHVARVSTHRAAVELAAGELPAARARLVAALPGLDAVEDPEGSIEARLLLAEIARRDGEGFEAARLLADAHLLLRGAAHALLAATLPELVSPDAAAVVQLDAGAVRFGTHVVDLSRRPALRRVLSALVDARLSAPGQACTVSELLAAGWPGERMSVESGTARVYMSIRRLRALGLSPILRTVDAGYLLDPTVALTRGDLDVRRS